MQDLGEDIFSEPKQSATPADASKVLALTPINTPTQLPVSLPSHVTPSLPNTPPNIFIPIPAPAEFLSGDTRRIYHILMS